MKLTRSTRLIRGPQGWLRNHLPKLFTAKVNNNPQTNPEINQLDKDKTMNTTATSTPNTLTTTDTNSLNMRDVITTQSEYWSHLSKQPTQRDEACLQVDLIREDNIDETSDEPQKDTQLSQPVKVQFDKNHNISAKLAAYIQMESGIELEDEEAVVSHFSDSKRFCAARDAGVQAHKYLNGPTYAYWMYSVLNTHPEAAMAWHQAFLTMANLPKNHPVLKCRNRISNYYRWAKSASVSHHHDMLDILNSNFRRYAAAFESRMKQAA